MGDFTAFIRTWRGRRAARRGRSPAAARPVVPRAGLGSGSGSTLVCVLAEDADDFLRLVAIGYPEICWLDDEEALAERPDRSWTGGEVVNGPFVDRVRARGLVVPRTAGEVLPRVANIADTDSPDPFCRWLDEVRG